MVRVANHERRVRSLHGMCSLREMAGPFLGRHPLPVGIDEFDVQVRPRGVAGVAAVADQLALLHDAVRDLLVEMEQVPGVPVRHVQRLDQRPAVRARLGERGGGGVERGVHRRAPVDAGVEVGIAKEGGFAAQGRDAVSLRDREAFARRRRRP